MSEIKTLVASAVELAERGLSEAKFLDADSATFDYALFQAWDQLQTAAKHLEQARHIHSRKA